MFSSRNIHFAILGLILGASSGYLFAFYRAHSAVPPKTFTPAPPPGSAGSSGHSNEEMLALFKEALDRRPDDPELLMRYANFLFDIDRFDEAIANYQKILGRDPANLNARTDMATALWNLGRRDQAMDEYNESLRRDPNHMMTLHNLFVVELEGNRSVEKAAALLERMEKVDAKYEALPTLREQLAKTRGGK